MTHQNENTIRLNAARLLAATAPAWGLRAASHPERRGCCATAPGPDPSTTPKLAAFDWVI